MLFISAIHLYQLSYIQDKTAFQSILMSSAHDSCGLNYLFPGWHSSHAMIHYLLYNLQTQRVRLWRWIKSYVWNAWCYLSCFWKVINTLLKNFETWHLKFSKGFYIWTNYGFIDWCCITYGRFSIYKDEILFYCLVKFLAI